MLANSKRKSSFLLFFIFFCSCIIFSSYADDENKEKASPQEILRETYTLFTKASLQYWDNVKSLINQAQLKFTPPDLENSARGHCPCDVIVQATYTQSRPSPVIHLMHHPGFCPSLTMCGKIVLDIWAISFLVELERIM
ncbi:unnamed protein product [Cuscuta epithymum]|uniref:Uncharacterized protein n=1 Tax=Cuscuta epithymum TaxID=186058 RepID=A0AAV0FVE7_9ASTE|nr:unnamed protein product [Cuscuta epithymum]